MKATASALVITAAAAALTLTFGSPVRSQAAEPALYGCTHNFISALTLSYTAPNLKKKDEGGRILPADEGGGPVFSNSYEVETFKNEEVIKRIQTEEFAAKSITFKFGNLEILNALAESRDLPTVGDQEDPSPAGWALVGIANTEGMLTLYARHAATKTLFSLQNVGFSFAEEGGFANNVSSKIVTTTDHKPNGDTIDTVTYTGAVKSKAAGTGSVVYKGSILPLTGLYTETGSKHVAKTQTFEGAKITTLLWVVGARKLDKINATAAIMEGVEEPTKALVEGNLSLTAGVITDLNVYAPAGE